MRFKSAKTNGFQAFAVAGVNTVSFGITATVAAREGLLGFAVERVDPVENERFFMAGFKVFQSVIPYPQDVKQVSTFEHPVQSFVWDDFTAKPDRGYQYFFYPVRGKARNLDRSSPPIVIEVITEPLFSKSTHDVFFNRGVASSQAYSRRFHNMTPDELAVKVSPEKAQEALDWLSRDLDNALLKFIDQAKEGDALRCAFYEFRYLPVAQALKAAIQRGVDVKIILDGKENAYTDKEGVFHESFPRKENLAMVKQAKIPKSAVVLRAARSGSIQHNKFMVLLKGAQQKPAQVWTGSTNISSGGIHGQTNVGHWVRDRSVAEEFLAYWELLRQDLGGTDDDSQADVRSKNKQLRQAVEQLDEVPLSVADIPEGTTTIFSPRQDLKVLDMYVDMVDQADSLACITLAFGINKAFKSKLMDNAPHSPLVFMLLEKEDRPKKRRRNDDGDGNNDGDGEASGTTDAWVAINAANNVYKAWGSLLREPIYQWTRETNARILKFNSHVSYVHSKFLLMDPLSANPIVVTGSANFSDNSTKENDENMLIVRGDTRVADIYFTEFNRLFNHYYFRAVAEATARSGRSNLAESLFLREKPNEWLSKYRPGELKQKRVDMFARMKGFAPVG